MTDTRGKVVFTGTSDWWRIIEGSEIALHTDAWMDDSEIAANLADLNLEDPECWVARVLTVAPRHAAIKPGDYACCQGVGADVTFVRLND